MTSLRTALALAGAGLALGAPVAGAQSAGPLDAPPPDATPGAVEVVEGRALVRFAPGTDPRAVDRAFAAAGVALVGDLGLPDAYEVRFDEALDERAVARTLGAQPGVRWAEPDVYGEVLATPPLPEVTPADASFGTQWPLDGATGSLGAKRAWGVTQGAPGVEVGVIDVGVNFAHPELQGAWAVNPGEIAGNAKDDDGNGYVDDRFGYDFGSDDADPGDSLFDVPEKGHGTLVAGIIGARADATGLRGLAPDARMVPIKVANAKGNFTASKVAKALVYAQRRGVDVANVSLTVGIWTNSISDALTFADDVLVVAGSGNHGQNLNWAESYPCESNHANVVCVTSVESDGALSAWAATGNEVDLAAPGGFQPALTFAGTAGGKGSRGTSLAAPHVSATAALLFAMNPSIPDATQRVTPVRARAALMQSVVTHPSLTYTTYSGGRLNALGALQELAVPKPTAVALAPAEVHPDHAKMKIAVEHHGVALTNLGVQWRAKGQAIDEFWWPSPLSHTTLEGLGGQLVSTLPLFAKGHFEYRTMAHNAYGATQWSPWVAFDNLPDPVDPGGPTEVANPPKPTH